MSSLALPTLFQNFFCAQQNRAAEKYSKEFESGVMQLEPTELHSRTKLCDLGLSRSMSAESSESRIEKINKYKVKPQNGTAESFNLINQINKPALIKKRFGHVRISEHLDQKVKGFAIDGFDDSAYLAKESVSGIAQPLVHLGVLSVFYPFVKMGADGLRAEYKEIKEEKQAILEDMNEDKKKLIELHNNLPPTSRLPRIINPQKYQYRNASKLNFISVKKKLALLARKVASDYSGSLQPQVKDYLQQQISTIEAEINEKKNQQNFLNNQIKNTHSVLNTESLQLHQTYIDSGKLLLKEIKQLELNLQQKKSQLHQVENRLAAESGQSGSSVKLNETEYEYVQTAFSLAAKMERYQDLKWDKPMARAAGYGMRGMQIAMGIYMAQAVTSLISFIDKASAPLQFVGQFSEFLGYAGNGIMGGAQLLMMISGLIKVSKGVKAALDIRSECKNINKYLKKIETHEDQNQLRKVLEFRHDMRKREKKWRFWEKVLPGTSLTIGQGLMCAWSAMSLAVTITSGGVGLPVGIAMMLGMLVPGVGLTLAATLPKIGLDYNFEKLVDNRFGMNGEEEGFDAEEYRKTLPTNVNELVEHINQRIELLENVRNHKDNLSELLEANRMTDVTSNVVSLRSTSSSSLDQSRDTFSNLYRTLSQVNRLEDFAEAVSKKKSLQHTFDKVNLQAVDTLTDLSFKHLYKPWQLRKTILNWRNINVKINEGTDNEQCFNARVKHKTLEIFNPENVRREEDFNEVNDLAQGVLRDFAKRQLRAEINAAYEVLWMSLPEPHSS